MFKRSSLIITLMLLASCGSSLISSSPSFDSQGHMIVADEYQTTYAQARRAQGYKSATPTMGEVPILIIPVTFSDYPCLTLPNGCEGTRQDIEAAFFGDASDTGWQSVTSFYETSSYGALSFYGTVAPWYRAEITAAELLNRNEYSVSRNIAEPALTWYRETIGDDLKQFDSDSDGYLDAVYFVYSVPANDNEDLFEDEDRVFWAYTMYDNSALSDKERPRAFHFGWSSYDFMYKDGYYERDEQGRILRDENDEPVFHPWTDGKGKILIDAHTFIHELGHFLGLPDYYSYDSDIGDWGPFGALDMMDYNVGDHNAFSKSVYGWLKPQIAIGEGEFTIAPLSDQPDTLIIPIEYNQTLLDEYIMIEYYRPEGLNQKDASLAFAGRYPKQFSIPGIKIYHVDARIGRYVKVDGRWTFNDYVSFIGNRNATTYYGIANSNSASRGAVPYNKLLHLLEPSGINRFMHGYYATDASLFKQGDVFSNANYPNFTFNSGAVLPYDIEVTSMSDNAATLTITRRAA